MLCGAAKGPNPDAETQGKNRISPRPDDHSALIMLTHESHYPCRWTRHPPASAHFYAPQTRPAGRRAADHPPRHPHPAGGGHQ